MAACKPKSCSDKRSRKWSDEELKKFAKVLADDYAFDLETLALKNSSDDQIFHTSILAAKIGIFAFRITETEQ